ncbi:MAG: S16 family serine protease [Candidatus Aenigmatarchaeota archaeon]
MREKRKNKNNNNIILLLSFLVIILSIFSIYYNLQIIFKKNKLENTNNLPSKIDFASQYFSNYSKVEFPLLAVDENGNGVITKLIVEVKNGSGKVLVNIENLLFWIDTQNSIRIAKNLAEKITKINTSNLDIIYTIEANASIIGGPSAGSAITIATIAALTQKEFKKDVVITGTIDENGNIGRVGAIKEKCLAAKNQYNAKICLVPRGQSIEYELIPKRDCTRIGNFEFCRITFETKEIDISKEIGMKVIEVHNIEDALKYFFS